MAGVSRRKSLNFPSILTALSIHLTIIAGEYFTPFNVTYDHRALIIAGKRRILISAGIHYPRATPEMWPKLIARSKEGGADVIETYTFWNGQEPTRGQISKGHVRWREFTEEICRRFEGAHTSKLNLIGEFKKVEQKTTVDEYLERFEELKLEEVVMDEAISVNALSGTKIHGVEFEDIVRLVRLGGNDIILGGDWMRGHNPMLLDFVEYKVTVTHKGKRVELKGMCNQDELKMMTANGVKQLLRKSQAIWAHLFTTAELKNTDALPEEVQEVLNEFLRVFAKPKSLSPTGAMIIQFSCKEMLIQEHNKLTVKDKFSIPLVDDFLDELRGSSIYSKIDLRAGYHQIRMNVADVHKNGFRTHLGYYEFKVMPFGLTNVPATFQSLMNSVFTAYIRKFVLVFFDDIFIYSASMREHVCHLRKVLEILQKEQLFAKMSKCAFGQKKVEYLGYVITGAGVATDPFKIEAMINWPVPKTLKGLRGFLGLTRYYKNFVRSYGMISRPLTNLLKKNAFSWSSDAEAAFQELKTAMSTAPVFALANFSKTFVIETDACTRGIGEVLMQQGRPLAYFSKALALKHLGLSTYEKEFLAVFSAVDRWRHYLQGAHFIIRTDHHSLKFLLKQRVTTTLQQKGLTKLLGLDYEVQYKKGTENRVVDALSRRSEEKGKLNAFSTVEPTWMKEISLSYEHDSVALQVLTELITDPYGTELRQVIFHALHQSPLGGHSGQQGTYKRAKMIFYWPTMRVDIFRWVSECDVCQRTKNEHVHPPSLLQPLPIPESPWHDIAMDFIEGLPTSNHRNIVLVVVDRLTKYGHFLALKHPYIAQDIAELFLTEVYRLHGLPPTIVSDRDVVFTSQFWKQLFRTMVAYHLELPAGAQLYPVFHISHLKKKISASVTPQLQPLVYDSDGRLLIQPVAILQCKMVKLNNVAAVKVLVEWAKLGPNAATWEYWSYV
ncbi:hypothetical protein FXO38_12900 [Capsicum annuum]|nr:hypothetical protein FXO38_12900 [Capsicum annuum]